MAELFGRFPDLPGHRRTTPLRRSRPLFKVEHRESNQSHLRMTHRPEVDL